MSDESTEKPATGYSGPEAPRSTKVHYWVIGGLFCGSLLMGVISYGLFVDSEKELHQEFAQMAQAGKDLSVEGCVDEVLAWRSRCDAMATLCDRSIGRMMEICMNAADRSSYCAGIAGEETVRSTFGFEECKARGEHETRKRKKVCGTVYRAAAAHCDGDESAEGATEP